MITDPTSMRISRHGSLIMPVNERDMAHVASAFYWPDMPGQEHWADSFLWLLGLSDYRGKGATEKEAEDYQNMLEDMHGAKKIQELQRLNGIEESYASALNGWQRLSPSEKENTEAAYDIFCQTKGGNYAKLFS